MLAALAEYLDDEIRSAVHHLGVIEKIRWAVHESAEAHATLDAVQITAARGLQLRKQIDCTKSRRGLAVFGAQIATDFTDVLHFSRFARDLSRHEYEIGHDHE